MDSSARDRAVCDRRCAGSWLRCAMRGALSCVAVPHVLRVLHRPWCVHSIPTKADSMPHSPSDSPEARPCTLSSCRAASWPNLLIMFRGEPIASRGRGRPHRAGRSHCIFCRTRRPLAAHSSQVHRADDLTGRKGPRHLPRSQPSLTNARADCMNNLTGATQRKEGLVRVRLCTL